MDSETFATTGQYLDVGEGHRLWCAQFGDPHGVPLVWVHGGPGGSSSLAHLHLIDVPGYRIILFDQRGCGRSVPLGEIRYNDTQRLVADIERLRRALSLPPFVLGGGSWGATLALAYAARHRDHVRALMLRAPFLGTRREVDAFFQPEGRASSSAWRDFAAQAPPSKRDQLLRWYGGEILAGATPRAEQLALAWTRYEHAFMTPGADAGGGRVRSAPALLARVRVQAHFLMQNCFLGDGELLETAARLDPLPVAILHGAEDRLCPADNARLLAARLPKATVRVVPGAGHDPYHPAMAAELRAALQVFRDDGDFRRWQPLPAG
jgi:proline iminopeptidase